MATNPGFFFGRTAADAFGEATIQALYSIEVLSLVRGNSTRKMDNTPNGDVTAIVHFTGNRDGYFSIGFSRSFAGNHFENMTDESADETNEDLEEEIGKFASKIAAGARDQLQSQGHDIFPTSITVIHGNDETLPRTRAGTPILTPFKTGDGNIYLEVDF